MRGIISCIKHSEAQGRTYFVASSSADFRCEELKKNILMKVGEIVDYDDTANVENDVDGNFKKEIYKKLDGEIQKLKMKEPYKKGIADLDKITSALWDKLEYASDLFLKKLLLGAPIIIRFHNDADGSGGAYSLYLGIKDLASSHSFPQNIIWIMNKGVSYSRSDAENDALLANNYDSLEKPLLILIDFGTSVDSNVGIKTAVDKFDIIWLDHHPIVKGFEGTALENYINPWQFGGDSNYTAGFLTSAFTKTFSKVDTREYENASFIGDYSAYVDVDAKGTDTSTIFDLITSDLEIAFGSNKANVTPQEFEGIFKNKEKSEELLRYANVRLNDVLDAGVGAVKRYKAKDFDIFLLDYEDIRTEESKYPLPGRFASKLVERINKSGSERLMVIVQVGAYILMRLDKKLCGDIEIPNIVDNIKEQYGDAVEAGGGHRCAGTVKLRDKSNKKSIISNIINSLK